MSLSLLGILIISGIAFISLLTIQRLDKKYQRINKLLKLKSEYGLKNIDNNTIYGTINDFNIKVENTEVNNRDNIVIKIWQNNKKNKLKLRKESIIFDIAADEVKTGDKYFDEKVLIEAQDELYAIAVLSNDIRNIIINFFNNGYDFQIQEDSIDISLIGKKYTINEVKQIIKEIIYISKKLFNDDIMKCLITNIKSDTCCEIRRKNFILYIENNKLNEIKDQLLKLKSHSDIEIAFLSSFLLKEHGLSDLKKILKNNYQKIDTVSFIEYKKKIINYIAEKKIVEGINWLIKLLHKNNKEIITITINALSRFKNINAIEYLLPFTKSFYNTEIKMAAKKAINKIQGNIPKNQRGALTLSRIEKSGELFIADDKKNKGKLSIKYFND